MLGLPAIAVSQQSRAGALDYRFDGGFGFEVAAAFVARLVERIEESRCRTRACLNINVPAAAPVGVEVTSLGNRIYRDELKLESEEERGRRYWIYGSDPGFHDVPGTDLAAVAAGRIAITPIHFDLTDRPSIEALARFDLQALLDPAVREASREAAVSAAPAPPGRRRSRHGRSASARASCASSSNTTPAATTSSTTPRSATTRTTACSTSCGGSRRSTRRWRRPTRPPSASAASRSGAWRRSATWSRCCRSPTPAPRRSCGRGWSGCATTSPARGSSSRTSSTWSSPRSTAWRSACCTATACSSGAPPAATARSARTSPTTCARSGRSRCASATPPACWRCGARCTCR